MPGVKWQKFKDVFRHRFRDTHTDQCRFMRLQTVRQSKNRPIQVFADRCTALAQKIGCKVDDPVAQRIRNKNADRMLLARFVAALSGVAGTRVRFSNPQTLDQALKTTLCVQGTENKKCLARAFTLASIICSEYVRLAQDTRTTGRTPQLTGGMQQLRREVSVIKPHVATSQRTQKVETRRPKLQLKAISVKHFDTSRECVQHD